MTCKIQKIIKARDVAYRSGERKAYSRARTALRRGIKSAKLEHKRQTEAHFINSTNPRQVWEGIRALTDYKKTTFPSADIGVTLAEDLNLFDTRFDRDNNDNLPCLPVTLPQS